MVTRHPSVVACKSLPCGSLGSLCESYSLWASYSQGNSSCVRWCGSL